MKCYNTTQTDSFSDCFNTCLTQQRNCAHCRAMYIQGCHLRQLKTRCPNSITACIPAPRALAPAHGQNSRTGIGCRRCSPPPIVRVWSGGVTPEKCWSFRCKFLLPETLSARKLTPAKVQNTVYFHSRLYCITCTQHGNTEKRDNWRPDQDYDGTWD